MQPTRAWSYRDGTGRFLLAGFDAVPCVKGHRDIPVGGQLISLRVDRLCPW